MWPSADTVVVSNRKPAVPTQLRHNTFFLSQWTVLQKNTKRSSPLSGCKACRFLFRSLSDLPLRSVYSVDFRVSKLGWQELRREEADTGTEHKTKRKRGAVQHAMNSPRGIDRFHRRTGKGKKNTTLKGNSNMKTESRTKRCGAASFKSLSLASEKHTCTHTRRRQPSHSSSVKRSRKREES